MTGCFVRLGNRAFAARCWERCFSLPGMMCTCCAAPVAAGMRRQQVSMGGALAFWMGESVVKPGDAGVYGVRPRLGFCGDSSGGGAGDGVADCDAGAKNGCVKHRKRRHRSKLTYRKHREDFFSRWGQGAMDAFLEYDPGLHPCSTGVGCRSRVVIPPMLMVLSITA